MHRSASATRVTDPRFPPPPTRSLSVGDGLPTYNPRSDIGKKLALRARFDDKLVHVIPAVLIASLILLWFFSNSESRRRLLMA